MKELLIFSLILWIPPVIVLVKKMLWNVYFWQIKEYRFDRFFDHIHWDQDNHNRNKYTLALKFILFAGSTLLFSLPQVAIASIFGTYTIWISEGINYFAGSLGNSVERPKLKSPRNILILILFIVLITYLILFITAPFVEYWYLPGGGVALDPITGPFSESLLGFDYVDAYLYLGFSTIAALFLDIVLPFIIALLVALTSPLATIRRELTIWKAERKWRHLKDSTKIIGITGSQGKTTLKEIVAHILSEEFEVSKTPENYNTDFGVAYSILKHVKKKTDFFVAEMGAYRRGEIKKMVRSFPPVISVITDIDLQHVSLFGSKEKLFEAKAEIARYMKPGGLAILNGDNENIEKLEAVVPGEVALVFTDKNKFVELTKDNRITSHAFIIENIKETKKYLSFDLTNSDGNTEHFKVKAKGNHLVQTFAQAVLASHAAGISFEKIREILKNFSLELPRMSIDAGDNGSIILNNTYNSSRKGFMAAIATLNDMYDGKHEDLEFDVDKRGMRVVITKGILELGHEKKDAYIKLAKFAQDKIDGLITTDHLLAKTFKKHAKKVYVVDVKQYDQITYAYRGIVSKGDVVLLEGRMKPTVLAQIVSDKR